MLLRTTLCLIILVSFKAFAGDNYENLHTRQEFIERTAFSNALELINSLEVCSKEDLGKFLESYDLQIIKNGEPYTQKMSDIIFSCTMFSIGLMSHGMGLASIYYSTSSPRIDLIVGSILVNILGLSSDAFGIKILLSIKNKEKQNELWFKYCEEFNNVNNSGIYEEVSDLTIQILSHILGFEKDIENLPKSIRRKVFDEREKYLAKTN